MSRVGRWRKQAYRECWDINANERLRSLGFFWFAVQRYSRRFVITIAYDSDYCIRACGRLNGC